MLNVVAAFLMIVVRAAHATDLLTVEVTPTVVGQGGVCLVAASSRDPLETARGEFDGERFPLTRMPRNVGFQGLLGIDMSKPSGSYRLKVSGKTASQKLLTKVITVSVKKVMFGTQRLTLPRSMVDLDPETLQRVNRESRRMKAVLRGYRQERLWRGAFIRPVDGDVTTPFGVRRILNDQPRSPHSGVDLRAPEGTPIHACNDGMVVLVGEMFFSGKSVVLDHGFGMYSMYFHLSEARVQEGEAIPRGAVIGLVGSTGRASGPHLHWGVRLNGARVDPLSLIRLSKDLEE